MVFFNVQFWMHLLVLFVCCWSDVFFDLCVNCWDCRLSLFYLKRCDVRYLVKPSNSWVFCRVMSCFELFKTGTFNWWFGPDLTETMILIVYNLSGNSISPVSNSIGTLLVVLPKFTLHWILTNLPAGIILTLGILCTTASGSSEDVAISFTRALILLD